MNRAALLLVCLPMALGACHARSERAEPARAIAPTHTLRDAILRPASASVGTSVALADVDGRRMALVADEDEEALTLVDLENRNVVARHPLGGEPGQILVAPGGTIFVAVRGKGRVVAARFRSDRAFYELTRSDTGLEPYGLALTPDGATLLVTSIGDARVDAYAARGLAPTFSRPVSPDPRSIVVTSDGARAFVSHATGSAVSVVDLSTTDVPASRRVSLDVQEKRRDFGMPRISKPGPPDMLDSVPITRKQALQKVPPGVAFRMKRTATQGFALTALGGSVYVPETVVMTGDRNAITTGYGSVEQSTLGTNVPYLARVDLSGETLANKQLSGPDDRLCFERKAECLLPRAAANDGSKIYVACLDSDEILVIDPAADAEHAPACRTTLPGRARVKVDKPSGVAIDRDRPTLAAYSAFTRRLTIASLDGEAKAEISLPRSGDAPSAAFEEGRRLFHTSGDSRIAQDGRACASCHVEGRQDALVWPTPKGKRQTPMLAGRIAGTAPYGWNGEHPTLTLHIKSTLANLDGTGLPASAIEALTEYLTKMKAPSARRSDVVALRGKTIFASSEAGCSSCHIESTGFTDGEAHALGGGRERFDTPSLAFVGKTAPYFHDGRYSSIEELIDQCDGSMGNTKQLAPEDRTALAAYLRSL